MKRNISEKKLRVVDDGVNEAGGEVSRLPDEVQLALRRLPVRGCWRCR